VSGSPQMVADALRAAQAELVATFGESPRHRPLLDRIAGALSTPATSPDDAPDVYVPGRWRCPRCEFASVTSTISLASGTIGHTATQVDARDAPPSCPNDGEIMLRATWREAATENYAAYAKLVEDLCAATGADSLPRALAGIAAVPPNLLKTLLAINGLAFEMSVPSPPGTPPGDGTHPHLTAIAAMTAVAIDALRGDVGAEPATRDDADRRGVPRADDPIALLATVVAVDAVPCGQHREHDHEGGLVFYCPWCEADALVADGELFAGLAHKDACPAQRARVLLAAFGLRRSA